MQLEGKKIILTGGAGGIGSLLAERLRGTGANVLTIDRSEKADIVADLSSSESLSSLCSRFGSHRTDILINLAGLMYFGDFTLQPVSHLETMLRVNLQAPMHLTQAVLPGMLARKEGMIVNIGSVLGAIPFPHFVTYSATKGGLKAFSDSLRREYDDMGINVVHVSPRAVKTPLNTPIIDELHKKTKVARDTPEKVVDLILHAIRKQKKNTTIGLPESFFSKLNALFPQIIDHALIKNRDTANLLLKEKNEQETINEKAA